MLFLFFSMLFGDRSGDDDHLQNSVVLSKLCAPVKTRLVRAFFWFVLTIRSSRRL